MSQAADAIAYGRSIGLEDDLRECVKRVIAIDQDDALYVKMLSSPTLPLSYNNSVVNTHYDGGVIAQGLLEVLKVRFCLRIV